MAQSWQTVRVFISSTFCDMHAEQNHLVKLRPLVLLAGAGIDMIWATGKEETDAP